MRLLARHRAILYMLCTNGERITHLRLVKLMFLLRQEGKDAQAGMYDFLPYHHGPFSFNLYRDIGILKREGLLRETGPTTWSLTKDGVSEGESVGLSVRAAIKNVMNRYSLFTTPQLLEYIYETYPWYASRSKSRNTISPEIGSRAPGVYTVGCSGATVEGFMCVLIRNRVEKAVDVRSNPISRVYGFHKSRLRSLLAKVGIAYEHHPDLGINPELRARFPSPTERRELLDRYERTTLEESGAKIAAIAESMKFAPSALLCQEKNPEECHRSRLARRISEITDLPVLHLST